MGEPQGLEFKVAGTARVVRANPGPAPTRGATLRGHVVCRGPDGQVKWEADTVPVSLRLVAGDRGGEVAR